MSHDLGYGDKVNLVASHEMANDKFPGVACKSFMPRETRIAAPVSYTRWLCAAVLSLMKRDIVGQLN